MRIKFSSFSFFAKLPLLMGQLGTAQILQRFLVIAVNCIIRYKEKVKVENSAPLRMSNELEEYQAGDFSNNFILPPALL